MYQKGYETLFPKSNFDGILIYLLPRKSTQNNKLNSFYTKY